MAITYHVIDALRSQVDSMVGPLKGTGWLWLIIPPSIICIIILASLMAQMVKKLPAMRETRFDHWVGKIPWRREWLPTPVFLPREFHGQRSLVGYSPWDYKELYMTD